MSHKQEKINWGLSLIQPKEGNLNSLIKVQQENPGDIARGAGISEGLKKFKSKRESITLLRVPQKREPLKYR